MYYLILVCSRATVDAIAHTDFISHTSCIIIVFPLLLQLEADHFYVHEVTLVFLQRGIFQLDVKSMTPSNDSQGGGGGGGGGAAEDSLRLDSRTGSGNEAILSRSPIRKVSQQSSKTRPSLQQRSERSSVDIKGKKAENSRRSSHSSGGSQGGSDGSVQGSKEKNLGHNSKNSLATSLPKKPKPPVASQAGASSSGTCGSNSRGKRPGSGDGSKEGINSRTSSTGDDDPLSILPSAYVARMVSMIEKRGTPPPVPMSARPKLKPVVDNTNEQQSDRDPSLATGNNVHFAKKLYPTLNGSSALAKPVPLSQPPNSSSSGGSDLRGTFTAHLEERQRGEQSCQDESSSATSTATTTTTTSKGTKSSTKQKRLTPDRMESVVLLSSNSRSQNLWNARLQSSVRLLSGPHFTFTVT